MSELVEWYRGGGPLMGWVGVAFLVAVVIVAERAYVLLVRGTPNGRAFIERSLQLVRSGKIEDAIKLCTQSKAILPDLGLLILRSRTRDEADLQHIATAAMLSLTPSLRRRLEYLPTLAVVSLLLGVVGLASGLDRAFSAGTVGALAGLATRPVTASAASAAVIVLAHAFLTRQAEAIAEQIDEYSARLINALIERPDVRLGHR